MSKKNTAYLPLIIGLIGLMGTGMTLGAHPALAQEGEQGAASAAGQGGTWTDPKEGAFSVQAPVGWQLSGGLMRNGATNFRQSVQAFRPDSDLIVQIGDAGLPPFVVPTPDMLKGGLTEGQLVNANGGVQILLMKDLEAKDFNDWYANYHLTKIVDDFKLGVLHRDADLSQQYTAIQQKVSPLPITLTVAENAYSGKLKQNGNAMTFVVFSVVLRTQSPDGTVTWLARPILLGWRQGEHAAADKAQVFDTLERLMTTWKDNPDWIHQYDEKVAKSDPAMAKTSPGLRASVMGTYWKSPEARKTAVQHIGQFMLHIPGETAGAAAPPPASNNPFGGQ